MQKLSTRTDLRIRITETRRPSRLDARCSTDAQDLTAQRDALTGLGVKPNRIYVDHGPMSVMAPLVGRRIIMPPVAGSVQPTLDVRLRQGGPDPAGTAGHRDTGWAGEHGS